MFPFQVQVLLASIRVLLTNDDGWATASIRAQHAAFKASDIMSILCAPADNMSGSGSLDFPPTVRTEPCQWNTCPPGSSVGFNASDRSLNYVNSYPVTAVNYALTNLFDSPPDLAISGPNVGSNIGMSIFVSGTIGAAAAAAQSGIPALAISAASGDQLPYTALHSSDIYSLHALLSLRIINALYNPLSPAGTPIRTSSRILPPSTFLNINYPPITSPCLNPSAFTFVLTRAFSLPFASSIPHAYEPLPPSFTPYAPGPLLTTSEPRTCTNPPPLEADVVSNTGSCEIAVSVLDARTKMDKGTEAVEEVVERLRGFLGCSSL